MRRSGPSDRNLGHPSDAPHIRFEPNPKGGPVCSVPYVIEPLARGSNPQPVQTPADAQADDR
jgi:hypothetical protein